jgi:hypothetical protein
MVGIGLPVFCHMLGDMTLAGRFPHVALDPGEMQCLKLLSFNPKQVSYPAQWF